MIRRFFSQAWLYYKGRAAAFDFAEFICFDAGYPIITLIFYCLLAAYSFQTADLTRWVIGNAFLMCTNTCIFGLGNVFSTERYYGRLRSIIAAPCMKLPIVLANGLFPALNAVAAVVMGFAVGWLVFGVDFSNVNLGLAAITILCAMASAAGFGLLLSAFGLLTDSIYLLLNIMSYVLMIFTGAEFPVSQLPAAGRIISRMLPLTRSIQAMNLLFGGEEGSFPALLFGELGTAAVYVLLSWGILSAAERVSRKNGRFDMF